MPRNYLPKKPRKTARNPWLRRRERFPADPEPGEPRLADFFRHHVPSFLTVAGWIHELGWSTGARISEQEIAKSVYKIALVYRQGRGIESRLREQSENQKLPGLKTQGRGQPFRHGDYGLIVEASELLQRMKGHNAPIGWGNWSATKGKRQKSEIQKFVEKLLTLIDPERVDLPAARYYSEVKNRLGLTIPRGSGNKRHTT
jgi:hypothetical protein